MSESTSVGLSKHKADWVANVNLQNFVQLAVAGCVNTSEANLLADKKQAGIQNDC